MAYEPKTWECGEVVTAEALNHLERGVEEASQGGGGYECNEITLYDGTVTTVISTGGTGDHTGEADASLGTWSDFSSPVTVTVDGVEYATIVDPRGESIAIGEFPDAFAMINISESREATIVTQGSKTFALTVKGNSIECSDCFEAAVTKIVNDILNSN